MPNFNLDNYETVEERLKVFWKENPNANINTELISNIASEQMNPEDWKNIAEQVVKKINDGNQGIVIGHGTDTMAYTSAALSFALVNSPIPIIFPPGFCLCFSVNPDGT